MSVDVLMPIHGEGEFLTEAIRSFNQFSIPNSRLIIILDRPNQLLLSKIQNMKLGTEISVVLSPGEGIVDALNFGIKNSSAKYIARLDSDDLIMDGRLQAQIQVLESNLEVACVGTQVELIDVQGQSIGYTRYPTNSRSIFRRLKFQNCIAHPSVMFRRIIDNHIFQYRKTYTGAEDYDLWLRISRTAKIINLDQVFTQYRISPNQYSASFGRRIREVENLSRAVNAFNINELEIDKSLQSNTMKKLFFSITKKNLVKSPILCSELFSSYFIGHIISKMAKKEFLLVKGLTSIPYAILAALFSPYIFSIFFIGLFKNRTIRVKP